MWVDRKVATQDVTRFVHRWQTEQYNCAEPKYLVPLSAYLGLNQDEYLLWVRGEAPLEDILRFYEDRRAPAPALMTCPTPKSPDCDDGLDESPVDYGYGDGS